MKLTDLETARICRGLSLLLHGGLFLSDGVFLLAQEESGELEQLLRTLGSALDQGSSLSRAMEDSGAFPEHVVGMTAVGERTGRLETALGSLASFYEERERTIRQIKGTLTYPAVLLALMLGVIGVLLVEVLPVFDRVYASLGSRLTGIAGLLLQLGQGLEESIPTLLVLAALAAAGAAIYRGNARFRTWVGNRFLSLLGDRGVLRRFNNARCAQALALGIHSGLPLEEALALAQSLLSDIPQAARRCGGCRERLEGGESLAQAMAEADLLPQAQSQLLSVALRSGSGDRMMQTIADQLTQEAQEALERTIAKVEPSLVIVCAILVGAILLAVMLPLMGLLAAMG